MIVKLSRRELGRRAFGDDGVRNQFLIFVEIVGERVDLSLQDVADHGESAVGVAVERAVTECELGFVPVESSRRPSAFEIVIRMLPRSRD